MTLWYLPQAPKGLKHKPQTFRNVRHMELLSRLKKKTTDIWKSIWKLKHILVIFTHYLSVLCWTVVTLLLCFIGAFFDCSGMDYSSSAESFFFMLVAESMICIPVNQLLLDGNISMTWLSSFFPWLQMPAGKSPKEGIHVLCTEASWALCGQCGGSCITGCLDKIIASPCLRNAGTCSKVDVFSPSFQFILGVLYYQSFVKVSTELWHENMFPLVFLRCSVQRLFTSAQRGDIWRKG